MNLIFLESFGSSTELRHQIDTFSAQWFADRSYFETKTSGSTGVPKVVRIEKKHAIASARATIEFLGLQVEANALLCLSIETIGGKMMFIRSMLHSMNLYVISPCANPLKNYDIPLDFVALAPLQLHTILRETPEKLQHIRTIIVGGGEIASSSVQMLKEEGLSVFQTFGMSETISHIALKRIGYQTEPCYTTLDHVTVSQENGLLCVHAPKIGIERLLTNDKITLLNERQFTWHGRADFVVNTGGVKVQIEELEHELRQYITESFFITARKDEKLGEALTLVVQGDKNSRYMQKKFYSFLVNKYHIPKQIAFVKHFFWTQSSKIDRLSTVKTITEFHSIY